MKKGSSNKSLSNNGTNNESSIKKSLNNNSLGSRRLSKNGVSSNGSKNKGITLIALVISIIIILILAGVSLSATVGENGVITKAQQATVSQKVATYKEEFEMNIISAMSDDGFDNRNKVTVMNENVKKYIPSLDENDIGKYAIVEGEMYYLGDDSIERKICNQKNIYLRDEGTSVDDFVSDVESKAMESIVKNMAGDSFKTTNEDGTETELGIRLYDKNFSNGTNWKIITEIENNETKATYGTEWYYVEAGTNITDIGILKNSYIINYDTSKAVKFDGKKHTMLAYGSNLAVTDNLVFNADPINMDDGSTDSWGGAQLCGFSNNEYNEDGTQKSGWSSTAFYLDGVDDYIEIYPNIDSNVEGVTIERYFYMDEVTSIALYKGPVTGSMTALRMKILNRNYTAEYVDQSLAGNGLWLVSNFSYWSVGGKWQSKKWEADWISKLAGDYYIGDLFITETYNKDGTVKIYINGNLKDSDTFSKTYINEMFKILKNNQMPINLGRSYDGINPEFHYYSSKIYSTRIYTKELNGDEVLANYNATVSYHNILVNGGNAETGGNTGGSDLENVETN